MVIDDKRNWEQVQRDTLTANTAQIVYQHLRNLESRRERVITRWIWELLQNAIDASHGADAGLICSVEYGQGKVAFQHNGRAFKLDEIAHLIYHGSTKAEDASTIGQYGSGFLTTHLLSERIEISGRLDDDREFDFHLIRQPDSIQAIDDYMKEAAENFHTSLSASSGSSPLPKGYTTRFLYPVEDSASSDVVNKGVSALKLHAPWVVAFNRQFYSISIESPGDAITYAASKRVDLSDNGLHEITVNQKRNGNEEYTTYLLAEADVYVTVCQPLAERRKVSVAIPIIETVNGKSCLEIESTPRLFLGLPLIGTEEFSLPAVVNSLLFTPSDGDRDGVNLWLNENDDANRLNQAVITHACELLIDLLGFTAQSGYENIHTLAIIPPVSKRDWLDDMRLKQHTADYLIEPIRQTPAVLCEQGAIAPEDAILPIAENEEAVIALWDLLNDLKDFRPKLPRREEAAGWCKAVKSWAAISDCRVEDFDESFDGRKLAEHIEKATSTVDYGDIDKIRSMLSDGVCVVEWLDNLYAFLIANGFDGEVRTRRIVLDQDGYLDKISNLHRDNGIDAELKNIADDILGLGIREELRDVRLKSLSDEVGKGDYENENVIRQIIDELNSPTDYYNLNDNFAQASVGLATWIVENEQWDHLDGFPAFSLNSIDGNRRFLSLDLLDVDDANMPLAPVKAWNKDVQQYADLFPPTQIVADDFYDAVLDSSVWKKLAEEGIVRTSIVITLKRNCADFLPDEPLRDDLDHETLNLVALTDVVFLAGIMDRVRNSPNRARLFWRFLTEWLVNHDAGGLTPTEAACECEDEAKHNYYPAAWLVPIAKNRWVPIGDNKRDKVNAKSLASLFRGSSEGLDISQSDAANAFLAAIRISRFDLMRETIAKDDKARAVMDAKLTNIMAAAQNKPDLLDRVPKFLEQLSKDAKLPDYLEERQKQTQRVRRNQQLGGLVEELVEASLIDEGFIVERTHVGADLLIQPPKDDVSDDDVTELTLSKDNEKWRVEVKATRDNDVRMTPAQAKNAVKSGDRFLLCVVPVEADTLPDLDDVRDNMRFVEDMGKRVSSLCDDLDDFEEYRNEITSYDYADNRGARLEIVSGNARVRVANSVWEDDGFGLDALATRLKPNN